MSKFTPADFNTIMNYLEYLEDRYYKLRLHVDPNLRKSFDYGTQIMRVYNMKEIVEEDFDKGVFNDIRT